MKMNKTCEVLDKNRDDILSFFEHPLKEKFKENLYFANGCIYSQWNNKKPKDHDPFLKGWFKSTH